MKKQKPKGLNTVNMLKFATKYLGMGSDQVMHIAERLYLSGYLTYPRTESTRYPSNFHFKGILNKLQNYPDSKIKNACTSLLEKGHQTPPKGEDAGDHPPICPTEKIPQNLDT